MTRWGHRWANVALAVALGLFLGVGYLSHRNTTELMTTAEWVRHTHVMLGALERVNGLMYAAEKLEHGYVLTGEPGYPEEFEQVAVRLEQALQAVLQLTENDPEQQTRMKQLKDIVQQRLPDLRAVLKIRKTRGVLVAWTAIARQESRKLMPVFRSVIREAREVEQQLLEARSTQAQIEARQTWYTVVLGDVLGFGLVVLAVVAIRRDNRKREHAEEALQQVRNELEQRVRERTAELAQANEELRREVSRRQRAQDRIRDQAALLDKVRDAILVQDLEGTLRFWNLGAQRVYGWASAEVLGKNARTLLGERHSSATAQADREVLGRGEWTGELRHVTREGKEVVVESRQTLLRDAQGSPAGRLVMNLDVSDRKRFDAQFRRAQRLESIGMLAGGIAHDLNNVLTPILMSTKLLRRERPESQRQNMLDTIQASAERGAGMVRQLVAFAGGMEGERTPIHLEAVIKELQHLLKHTLPKSITLQIQVAAGLWQVLGDATQLSQVLMNLCVNARDAMPQGGTLALSAENILVDESFVHAHVEAHVGPYVLIAVTDTGTGISPEVMDKIFDPFFTTKEHGKGTGLGLASALGSVKGHGGFITVYSEVDKGTRFALYFPAVESAETEQARHDVHAQPAKGGELVLVVDDEPYIVVTAKATLEDHGYRVLAASHGQEALDLFRQHHDQIQVVILDMMMPGLETQSILQQLHELNPKVAILTSSGLRPTRDMTDAVTRYAQGFLQKPYTEHQLLEALASVLQSG